MVNGFLRALSASERGNFGPITAAAVAHFQQTHLGPDHRPLAVTGVVDAATWWALEHPHGEDQRQRIDARIPAGLTPKRLAVLTKGLEFHALNVREQPMGSNRGAHVDMVLPSYLTKTPPPPPGNPWCCFCAFAIVKAGTGEFPLGAHIGSCYRAFVLGQARGLLRSTPKPGDIFLMLYRDDEGKLNQRGHAGIVLRADAARINTLEGNVGNRFALGIRQQSTIATYLDPYGADEQPVAWERGVVEGAAIAGASTR